MKKIYIPVLILFIDALILGLVFPLIPALILNVKYGLVTGGLLDRNFIYGIAVTVFPLFSIIGMYLLGNLSDKGGRILSLILGVGGKALSIALISAAVITHEYKILILAQMIFGFSGGIFAVAIAAAIDHSSGRFIENTIKWPVFAHIMGLTVGSFTGGIVTKLCANRISVSLIIAFGLCIISSIIISFQKGNLENSIQRKRPAISDVLRTILKNRDIMQLSLAYFFYLMGWSIFTISIKYVFVSIFGYAAPGLSILGAANGGTAAIMLFIILPFILVRFTSLKKFFAFAFILIITAVIITIVVSNNLIYVWTGNITIHLLGAFVSLEFMSEFSNKVGREIQGTIMGFTGALTGIALTFSGVISMFTLKKLEKNTLFIAIVCLLAAALIYKFTNRGRTEKSEKIIY